MMNRQVTKQLIQTIIALHEAKDYESLLPYISKREVEKKTWFTHNRFIEVCEAIEQEIGQISSLEHIETLKRKSSFLTLWKTTYSKTKDEVLWQITLDAQCDKVLLMHINWQSE